MILQELIQKKRYGRLQKALADISLLAGSPADAQDHYSTAADLARVSNDWVWAAAALQGLAQAKVSLHPRQLHIPPTLDLTSMHALAELSLPLLGWAVLDCAVPCCAALCCAMLGCPMLCWAVLCCAVLC